mgnify:CR=1 FL=1
MKNFVWAWSDEEGNYINEAESLSEILDDVLDYYSCHYQDFKIIVNDEKFFIQIDDGELTNRYEVCANPNALTEFLNNQAALVGRPDKFNIYSMGN